MSIAGGLQLCGLKKDQIKLVDFLLAHSDRRFVVRELARAAELPVTRAYSALSELSSLGLVERKLDKRLSFGMPDPEGRFRRFFAARTADTSEAQRAVFDAVARHAVHGREFVLLPSREEFYQAIYQMVARAGYVKMLSRSQWGIMPDTDDDYWRTQSWQLLRKRVSEGLELSYLVDEAVLRAAKDSPAVRRNIGWLQRQPGVRLAAADMRHAVSTVVTDGTVLMGFRNRDERQTAQGLLISNREFLRFFENIYDSTFNSGRPPGILRKGASR